MARRKLTDIERVAREQLGFSRLRPGQEDAVRAVLKGSDTVVVQRSGKSAIYQATGLLMTARQSLSRRRSPCRKTR